MQDSDGQFVGLNVGEDIAFAMENDCISLKEMRERVMNVAQMVDMDRLLDSSPFELSGGQKQRTSLAGVLVDDVDILLFDEPLANLDPATGKQAIEIIDEIHQSTDKTIIIIEHRLEDVLHRHVDRIILINDGRILADMDPHQLVSSTILKENGIREPLYITAMKYAGVTVTESMKPGYADTLTLSPQHTQQVQDWYNAVSSAYSPPMNPSVVKMENVTFSYEKGNTILSDVDFDIRSGEMVSIVGRNGAGKSTISKLLCGFEKVDHGTIFFHGEDIQDKSIKERAELIGLVMQNPNQMISQNLIFDEIALGLKLRNIEDNEIEERVYHALKICGLYPFRKWPISALSYGQKKRVTIASILALNPEVIILDEPTAGQDFRHYHEIMKFLVEINRTGVTVIMITHDMHLMIEYTPRAIVLTDGKVVEDAASSVILTHDPIIDAANLKRTSLFELAELVSIEDKTGFVQSFINYERQAR